MVMITQTGSSKLAKQNEGNATLSQPDDGGTDVIVSSRNNGEILSEATIQVTRTDVDPDGEVLVTASCAARVRQLASTRPEPGAVYLRVYVDAGGCSGFQYKFEILSDDDSGDAADSEEDGAIDPEDDVVFEKDGMRVVLDRASLRLLRGSTIDYVQEMIRSSFAVVSNPQSESACGCGSSFAVKNFESNPAMD